MQSAGTFGGLRHESKRSDSDSLGRAQRPSGKENIDNGISFAEKSRLIFNKYVEDSRQSLNYQDPDKKRFESNQGYQPMNEAVYIDN